MSPITILILGAAVWPDGQASPALHRRVMQALTLWQAEQAQRIICCGGLGRHAPSEAEVMARILIRHGVAPDRLVLEDRSTDTIQNITNAKALCPDLAQGRVILVTDRYHGFRARLIARALGLEASISSPDHRTMRRHRYARAWMRDRLALLKTGLWIMRHKIRTRY
ncbi:YdcF family protein (plasmid) [Thioclava litoralis]|uniref:YdcF family protein n=1 Tax=Thioclava litoralis TaxID=3076557 RepID=A0ABZ1E3Q2_9RHOB|nr:YdcF family protein [Thioclava sp. FTW29]